ncbi:MAG: membrane protein insertase YidC [Streptomyces sp.]|uniref:YidC/Oxa1 family membrane protein insertase n=1 Tax=Streptomyces sp. TaxID=1931 RepID=UPI0025FC7A05|nr:membrane protein insertase YidC [Streptomyces sp.]MBW8800757.1 membrane protein insertase YidC [Streptomyces sp.]
MSAFAGLVEHLADLLQPLFHASAAAAAIVLFTALVRLLVHPLSRAAARGQRARAALQQRIAELREKHGKNQEALQKAVLELHAAEKVSPLSGCLPGLLQLPAFFVLYHLFSSATIGGHGNALLSHALLGAPLGGRWSDVLADGGFGSGGGLVYLALFAVVAAVATFNLRRARRTTAAAMAVAVTGEGDQQVPGVGAVTKVMPYLSYFTLVTVAVVPLAAALYVVTSTTWSAVERAVLYR